jgi:hypothetical protein
VSGAEIALVGVGLFASWWPLARRLVRRLSERRRHKACRALVDDFVRRGGQ